MNKNPLVSIIIPVYNVEMYLDECLNSVINQDYKNLEIILVDDGSTDKSGEICDEFAKKDNRIKVIHQKNAGVSSARNKGLDSISGEFVTFVDSDDTIEKEHILNMVNSIDENVDIICSPLKYDIYKFDKKEMDNISALKYILVEKKWNFGWNNCNKLFRTGIVKNIRYFSDEKVGEDFSFSWKAFLNSKKIIFTNKKTYNYRVSDTSVIKSDFDKRHESVLLACDRFLEYIKNNNIGLLQAGYFVKADSLYYLCIKIYQKNKEAYYNYVNELKKIQQFVYGNKNVSFIYKLKIFLCIYCIDFLFSIKRVKKWFFI